MCLRFTFIYIRGSYEKKLFYEFIGKKIRQKREEKGLTLNELSLKTEIRKIYLQKIEEGKASRFSTTKLFMIAEALETHASMLVIGWEEFEKLACAE